MASSWRMMSTRTRSTATKLTVWFNSRSFTRSTRTKESNSKTYTGAKRSSITCTKWMMKREEFSYPAMRRTYFLNSTKTTLLCRTNQTLNCSQSSETGWSRLCRVRRTAAVQIPANCFLAIGKLTIDEKSYREYWKIMEMEPQKLPPRPRLWFWELQTAWLHRTEKWDSA